jgi:hypothetical protein
MFAAYFAIAHRYLAKLLSAVEKHKHAQGSTATSRVNKKLLPLSLLISIAVICNGFMAIPSTFYKAGGYFFLSGLVNSTLIVHFLHVLTIIDSKTSSEKYGSSDQQLSRIARWINESVDMIFSCMNRTGSSDESKDKKGGESTDIAPTKNLHSRGQSSSLHLIPAPTDAQVATQPHSLPPLSTDEKVATSSV